MIIVSKHRTLRMIILADFIILEGLPLQYESMTWSFYPNISPSIMLSDMKATHDPSHTNLISDI